MVDIHLNAIVGQQGMPCTYLHRMESGNELISFRPRDSTSSEADLPNGFFSDILSVDFAHPPKFDRPRFAISFYAEFLRIVLKGLVQ